MFKNGCKSTKCSTFLVPKSCCDRGPHQEIGHIQFATDHLMKYKLFRWNGGPLGRNVGAKTVHFEKRRRKFSIRRNPNKHWIRSRIPISANMVGQVWKGDHQHERAANRIPSWNVCQTEVSVNQSENKVRSNADVTYNPSNSPDFQYRIYTKKARLQSTHSITFNGSVYSYNLFLTNCN